MTIDTRPPMEDILKDLEWLRDQLELRDESSLAEVLLNCVHDLRASYVKRIVCPECGAPTWIQMADGFPTIFCYSATCHWKQQIHSKKGE